MTPDSRLAGTTPHYQAVQAFIDLVNLRAELKQDFPETLPVIDRAIEASLGVLSPPAPTIVNFPLDLE